MYKIICHHDIYCDIQILYLRTLDEVRGCAYLSGSSLYVCMYVCMATYRYYMRILETDGSARMRILVKIVTIRMYVCHHDINCDILILYPRILLTLISCFLLYLAKMYNIICS